MRKEQSVFSAIVSAAFSTCMAGLAFYSLGLTLDLVPLPASLAIMPNAERVWGSLLCAVSVIAGDWLFTDRSLVALLSPFVRRVSLASVVVFSTATGVKLILAWSRHGRTEWQTLRWDIILLMSIPTACLLRDWRARRRLQLG